MNGNQIPLLQNGRIILGVGIVILIALLWYIFTSATSLRVTSINPRNGTVHPTNGAITMTLSNAITNPEEVEQSVTTTPTTNTLIVVQENTITLFPVSKNLALGEYTILVEDIQAGSKKLDSFSFTFEVEDFSNGGLNKDQQAAVDIMDSEFLTALATVNPGVDKVITTSKEYSISYQLFGKEAYLLIDLDPENLPPRNRYNEWGDHYERVRNDALEFMTSQGVEPASFKINYEPKSIDDLYGHDGSDHVHNDELEIEPGF